MFYSSYRELINNLIEDKRQNPTDYFISLYIDLADHKRSDLKTLIKSYLKKSFDNNQNLNKQDNKQHQIFEKVYNEVRGLENISKGLALFIKFNLKKDAIKVSAIHVHKDIDSRAVVSSYYDLSQLLWLEEHIQDSIIVILHTDCADILSFRNSKLKKLTTLKNKVQDLSQKEYLETFSPRALEKATQFHGTGDRKFERQERQSINKFFNDIIINVTEVLEEINSYKYVILLHPESLNFISDDLRKVLQKKFSQKILLDDVAIKDNSKLKKFIQNKITQSEESEKKKLLDNIKENFNKYASSWKEILEASRREKIETLFIQDQVTKKGYVSNDNLLYLKENSERDPVENIVPFLIRKVISKGGEIYVFRKEDKFEDKAVVKLRFNN